MGLRIWGLRVREGFGFGEVLGVRIQGSFMQGARRGYGGMRVGAAFREALGRIQGGFMEGSGSFWGESKAGVGCGAPARFKG